MIWGTIRPGGLGTGQASTRSDFGGSGTVPLLFQLHLVLAAYSGGSLRLFLTLGAYGLVSSFSSLSFRSLILMGVLGHGIARAQDPCRFSTHSRVDRINTQSLYNTNTELFIPKHCARWVKSMCHVQGF